MARPRTDIQPRLLAAARAQFLSDGVDGASLRSIARAARTNIGMLYYYFPTKDDLFLAVIEEVYVGLLADLTSALSPDVPVEQRLERLYERISRVSPDEASVISLIIREGLVSSQRLERVVERFRRGHLPLVIATLQEGLVDGKLDKRFPLPLLMLMTLAVGALPQLLLRRVGHLPPFDAIDSRREELPRLLLDALLSGIGSRAR